MCRSRESAPGRARLSHSGVNSVSSTDERHHVPWSKGAGMKHLSIVRVFVVVLSLAAAGAIADDNLAAGTPVWVPVSHASWGHGVIQAKTPAGYTVKLDEGESQDFDQGDIALDAMPDAKDLRASSRVIAKKPYGYLAAKITEIDGDTYTVLYNDDASVEETSIDNLRLLLPPRPVPVAAAPAQAAPAQSAPPSGAESSSAAVTTAPATTAAPAAGATTASGGTSAAGKQDTPQSI